MGRLQHKPRLGHRTTISNHLKSALEILSLNTVELSRNLQKLLEENIFLEETRPAKLSLDDALLQNYGRDFSPLSEKSGSEGNASELFNHRDKSLQDHLLDQLDISDLGPRARELANIIITSLDSNGFIGESQETIARDNGFSKKDLSEVMTFLWQVDPPGVCAKDIWQSLEWQAQMQFPDDMILMDIIAIFQQGKQQIEELDEKILADMAAYLNIPEGKIKESLRKLQTLELNPAAGFSFVEQNFIYPEIIFTVRDDVIHINFSSDLLPDITLNSKLMDNFKSSPKQKDPNAGSQDKTAQKEKQKLWQDLYNEAKNVLKSVEYRKNSIQKIAKIIAKKQEQYLKKGEDFLKPMILKDIAEIAELNISTVSRIMKNKYCVTPYGMVPLSHFLSKRIKSTGDQDLGVRELKEAITRLIDSEDQKKPLSDLSLSLKLHDLGFSVKRRTVTKYRKLLHIPSTKQRTVLNSQKEDGL